MALQEREKELGGDLANTPGESNPRVTLHRSHARCRHRAVAWLSTGQHIWFAAISTRTVPMAEYVLAF